MGVFIAFVLPRNGNEHPVDDIGDYLGTGLVRVQLVPQVLVTKMGADVGQGNRMLLAERPQAFVVVVPSVVVVLGNVPWEHGLVGVGHVEQDRQLLPFSHFVNHPAQVFDDSLAGRFQFTPRP